MAVPNVGDILMLSQVAWKLGRAFTAGRKDAPVDFQAVETDVGGLAQALKQLAEALHAQAGVSLIPECSHEVQEGVTIILSSCHRTIHDLDSLVDRYQVIRKHRTVGGFAIERSWSDLVLAQYQTIIWTTEGGGLHDLSSLLQMHTKSIRLLTEAVQSESTSQLEGVVAPMAERFDSMYSLPGTLEEQLDEVSRFVQELAIANPASQAPPIPQRNPARSPTAEVSDPLSTTTVPLSPTVRSSRRMNSEVFSTQSRQRSVSRDSSTFRPASSDSSPTQSSETNPRTIASPRKRVSEFSFGGSSVRDSTSSYASSTSSMPSRDSLNSRHTFMSMSKSLPLPGTPELSEPKPPKTGSLSLLPPAAIRPSSTHSTQTIDRTRSQSTLSPFPARQDSITKLHRSSTTSSQKATFEKEAFRNSAVLCDVRGKLVEYSQQTVPDPENPSEIADIEMVEACDSCRITVVRKRITDSETRNVRVITSIWALSDDNNVRVELKMGDGEMYIPYSSYFSPAKVSMTVPCELRFHDVRYGNRLAKIARTSWVNYVFSDSQSAALFQNEIMGRTLLATLRTSKTMRIHEGTLSTFAYAEQMCALENLRIWEDTDTGAVIGLIHFSASFKAGYLAFYLNSSTHPVKVADVGAKEVKVKGLRVPIAEAGRAMRKDSVVDDGDTITDAGVPSTPTIAHPDTSAGTGNGNTTERRDTAPLSSSSTKKGKNKELDRKKIISGAKIEFATEAERRAFLELVQEYQRPERLCELPDLLGVN